MPPQATPPAATPPASVPPTPQQQQPRVQRPDAPPAPSTGVSPGEPPIPPGIQTPGQRDNRRPEGRQGEGRRGPDGRPAPDGRPGPDGRGGPGPDSRFGPDAQPGPNGRPIPDGRPAPDGRLGPDGRPIPDDRSGADGRRGPDPRLGPDTPGPVREPGQEFRGGAERQGGGEFRRFDPERRESRDDDRRDRRFDQEFGRREERQGDRLIIREGDDRTIIRENGRTIIRHDETERLRRRAEDVRVDRRGNEIETVIRRPGGVEIVTIQDDNGRLLRRIRRQGGRDYVLIDNRPRRPGLSIYLDLPPVRVGIPREEYIVEADRAGYDDYYEAFEAPPVEAIDRPYTLEEVRQNVRLRDRVRSVDVNTINFEFGEFTVPPDQVQKLQELAQALGAVIEKNPNEVFLIEGHTDAVGSDIDNLSLSDRRAEEIAAILSETYQIPAENLVTQGYGEQYLRVDTEGPSAENRRVTLRNITPLLNAEQQQQQQPQ
ncbi:OmpA family protein [Flaviflagellibacter deserti]|uniref:OmpA family protein n=1 Tax=Flaviflagellibacter deserti TaxID=2267266 RepID=A0ABV9Z4U0_9HYPH